MKKYVCLVCGYVYEGESAPEECPICHAPASKFAEQATEKTWAAEHVVGIAKGVDQRIIDGLRENFNGECCEVGMYLAMARVAHREGYPKPYEALKALTRTNEAVTEESIHAFIDTLAVSDAVKAELRAITPHNYTGI